MVPILPNQDNPSMVAPAPSASGSTELEAPLSKTTLALIWGVVACLLLGSSAVVRGFQDRRHSKESIFLEECPFPLSKIPRQLGDWKSSEDQKLDSNTLLITGGKEHIIRTYTDERTGVRLVVLLLFGPAEPVIPHVPAICYPANGFSEYEKAINRTVSFPKKENLSPGADPHTAAFRSEVYRKSSIIEGVYHSFLYLGNWTPDVASGQKLPRRSPGVFKLQIQRLVTPGERRDGDKFPEPIENFLQELLPVIDQEIRDGTPKATPKEIASK